MTALPPPPTHILTTGSADVKVISSNLYNELGDEKKWDLAMMQAKACECVFALVHTKPSTVMLVMTAHWKVPRMSIARATMMPISPGLSSVETHSCVSQSFCKVRTTLFYNTGYSGPGPVGK